jgi:lauroyl/myristoyl acyltransferase
MNIGQLTYKFGNFFGYQKSNMAATIEIYLKVHVDVCYIFDHSNGSGSGFRFKCKGLLTTDDK